MILKILKFKKLYREFKASPSEASGAEAVDMLREIFIIPKIIGLILLTLFFVFGFTSLITDPILFCRVAFWILLPIYLIFVIVLRLILKQVKIVVGKLAGKIVK